MEEAKKFNIPKLSSTLFTYELWGADNSILLDLTRLKANAIGYCDGGSTSMRPNSNCYAVMIEEEQQFPVCNVVVTSGEIIKYWIHIDKQQMGELFGEVS